ncbi:ABC transporter ATP-binding protein [Roseovarius ramblicola]|uniref:ABC transporter ATP-binding protein n=1 Tax=Roseovarius ramblicola TaxID=2022336 RepID=A0ABV5I3I2_9RHOB
MSEALQARGLKKAFNGVKAADDVSVTINNGEIVSLIGANGAGKTTFVNMVTGYLRPDSGTITAQGREITRLKPRQITRLGVCRSFQIPQVFNDLTLEENLLVAVNVAIRGAARRHSPLRSAGNRDARRMVEEILARFGLGGFRNNRATEVSGGTRKLLDVGMATISHPRVLLLDEPTSGVASNEKFAFMDVVMNALADDDVAVLFIEHDMDIVRRYAARVIVFHEGRILADGPTEAALGQDDVKRYVTGGSA